MRARGQAVRVLTAPTSAWPSWRTPTTWPAERVYSVEQTRGRRSPPAARPGLRVHVDGARLWNAAVALGVRARGPRWRGADTAMVTLSKGLCAPAGSLLVASQRADRGGAPRAQAARRRDAAGGGPGRGGPGGARDDDPAPGRGPRHTRALLAEALAACRGRPRGARAHQHRGGRRSSGRPAPDVVAAAARARRPGHRHGRGHAAPGHPPRRLPRRLRARRGGADGPAAPSASRFPGRCYGAAREAGPRRRSPPASTTSW